MWSKKGWELGWRGYINLIGQVMRCLNLKRHNNTCCIKEHWNIVENVFGTFTVGISTSHGYASRASVPTVMSSTRVRPRIHCGLISAIYAGPGGPFAVTLWPSPHEGTSDKHQGHHQEHPRVGVVRLLPLHCFPCYCLLMDGPFAEMGVMTDKA